ncbi:Uma2 family endonuclease [Streptomyces olivoreticuli]|uniref:Uma2 family endonuclease n=1 Tax=Streptomyces olivoreticuli TaxID=68246 RepID=UPI00265B2E76|nr:Uma2 family endonuclease [Streptomyces olivoreticuli]WKK22040.1 Uma2 family endonuclease [Streptomyces olivoreticuli]
MATMVETPRMTSEPSDSPAFEELCRELEKVDATMSDGYRTEIIGGSIVVSPWSKGSYLRVMRSFVRQLSPHVPEGHAISEAPCLFAFPQFSSSYGPDIHVSDEVLTNIDTIHLPGEALSLVGELTSTSTARFDRADKVDVYGKAGVPVYVLIDMLKRAVTVYSSPSDHGYTAHAQIEFGDTINIPAPFDCKLITADWQV